MPLRVLHVQHDAFVMVVTNPGPPPTEAFHLRPPGVDIVHFDVEVKTGLRAFRLGYPLKGEPRCRAQVRPQSRPTCIIAMLIGRVESEQPAPKS